MRLFSYPVLIEASTEFGGIFLFFTSGIIIAFFCFAFYLIWNQFLRKDTRLSTGLQVLRKKISDLENLSLSVEAQVDRQMSVVNERSRRMESLLQKTKDICEHLENNIKIAQALKNSHSPDSKKQKRLEETPPAQKLELNTQIEEYSLKEKKFVHSPSTTSPLKMVKERSSLDKQRKFQFGDSPFTDLDFMESP